LVQKKHMETVRKGKSDGGEGRVFEMKNNARRQEVQQTVTISVRGGLSSNTSVTESGHPGEKTGHSHRVAQEDAWGSEGKRKKPAKNKCGPAQKIG